MPDELKCDCKARILDAAEVAFATAGFEGASLREIVGQAGVNLASVYYYFQSKEGLMAAVFERRFGPLCTEHLNLLKEAEAQAQGRPLAVEKILDVILLPALRLAQQMDHGTHPAMRLIGRIATEPNAQVRELLHKQHKEVRIALLAALRRSLPELSEVDLRWRMEFVWSTLAFVMCNPERVIQASEGMCDPKDTDMVLRQMRQFLSAGFLAPAAGNAKA
jgi:AcrR family transcriptional regulator